MRTNKTFIVILTVLSLAIALPIPDPEADPQIYYNIINQNCFNSQCGQSNGNGGVGFPKQQFQNFQDNGYGNDSDDDSDSDDDD